MRAALGRNQRVNLVHDHRVDRPQRLAGVRCQQQVERFGSRDQDVGRLAQEPRALDRWRVSGSDGDRGLMERIAAAVARLAMPAIGARRLRSMSTASAFSGEMYRTRQRCVFGRHRLEHDPVDAPQEGGERLAAAGWRENQRRFAAARSTASPGLGRRRPRERIAKPVRHRRLKEIENVALVAPLSLFY